MLNETLQVKKEYIGNRKIIPILTKRERKELLERYELDAKDIRLLENVGINEARSIMNDIRNKFPKRRRMLRHVFSEDYVTWNEKYADEYYAQ